MHFFYVDSLISNAFPSFNALPFCGGSILRGFFLSQRFWHCFVFAIFRSLDYHWPLILCWILNMETGLRSSNGTNHKVSSPFFILAPGEWKGLNQRLQCCVINQYFAIFLSVRRSISIVLARLLPPIQSSIHNYNLRRGRTPNNTYPRHFLKFQNSTWMYFWSIFAFTVTHSWL